MKEQEREETRRLLSLPLAKPPEKWEPWLYECLPSVFSPAAPFAPHHREFWRWVERLQLGKPPSDEDSLILVLARGGGKTTGAEAAVVRLAAKGARKFVLYVRGIQTRANESVQAIAGLLESRRFNHHYPEVSDRRLSKYGHSRGWSMQRLRTASGFNVVGLGLDAAIRGAKLDEARPDLIVFDDIDERHDNYATVQKKIDIITRSILPTGTDHTAHIVIQNLVHAESIIQKLVNKGPMAARFLINRKVIGPVPAVQDLVTEPRLDKASGMMRDIIISGEPTWAGQDLDACQRAINLYTLTAFKAESQHEVRQREGRVYHQFTNENVYPVQDLILPGPDDEDDQNEDGMAFYHAHDFGSANRAWGLFARFQIGDKWVYCLVYEAVLPEDTTSQRAAKIKKHFAGRRIIAGWGGAASETQQRRDNAEAGLAIRLPTVTDVESQIDNVNEMLSKGALLISSACVATLDQIERCVRDPQRGIVSKSVYHHLDVLRYFAAGINNLGILIGGA